MAPSQTTAQVAVEAIINMPEAYSLDTMRDVLMVSINANVATLYTDVLRQLVHDRVRVS
jgi:hypothetical protein